MPTSQCQAFRCVWILRDHQNCGCMDACINHVTTTSLMQQTSSVFSLFTQSNATAIQQHPAAPFCKACPSMHACIQHAWSGNMCMQQMNFNKRDPAAWTWSTLYQPQPTQSTITCCRPLSVSQSTGRSPHAPLSVLRTHLLAHPSKQDNSSSRHLRQRKAATQTYCTLRSPIPYNDPLT